MGSPCTSLCILNFHIYILIFRTRIASREMNPTAVTSIIKREKERGLKEWGLDADQISVRQRHPQLSSVLLKWNFKLICKHRP